MSHDPAAWGSGWPGDSIARCVDPPAVKCTDPAWLKTLGPGTTPLTMMHPKICPQRIIP